MERGEEREKGRRRGRGRGKGREKGKGKGKGREGKEKHALKFSKGIIKLEGSNAQYGIVWRTQQ